MLAQSCATLDKFRRKSALTESMSRALGGKADYDKYTERELHAEVGYAEVLCLRALLAFIEDESLVNLIKGMFRMTSCWGIYK